MSEKKSLDSIQILRGVAAIAVIVHHACSMVAENGKRPAFLNQLGSLSDVGACGVDIFFVISGFIMVYVSRRAFGQPGAMLEFWRRRILRIVPLYWLYTTAMLALVLTPFAMKNAHFSALYTLKSYFFVPAFVPGSDGLVQPLLSPGWTLSYEMFFYLLFGLWLRAGQAKTVVPYLLGAFAVSLGAAHWLLPHSAISAFLGHTIIFEFLYGAFIAQLFLKRGAPARVTGAACIVSAILGFAATAFITTSFELRCLFWGVPAALLVHGALAFNPHGRIARLWVALGDASYSTYLLQTFLTLTAGGFLRRGLLLDRLPPDLLIVATIVACAAAGWCAFLLIEKPLNRWVMSRFPAPAFARPANPLPDPCTPA